MSSTYHTIKASVSSLIKEKGSKFYGYAFPVANQEEIKNQLETIREEHPKATHHCYAYRLGIDKTDWRANDDGEPTGTAGKPILGQIDAFGLSHILVIVVRYFGGTKLGVGGLISAYKNAVKSTLALAEIVEEKLREQFLLTCNYEEAGFAFQWAERHDALILEQIIGEKVTLTISVPIEHVGQMQENLPYNSSILIKAL